MNHRSQHSIQDFLDAHQMSGEYPKKIEKLKENFLNAHSNLNLTENELNAGLVWAVLSLNQLFESAVTDKQVGDYFLIDTQSLENIKEEILESIPLFDRRFLLDAVISKIEKISPLRKKLIHGSRTSLENVYDDSLHLHEDGKLDSALYTFLSVFDFIYENRDLFSTEEFLSYTFSVLSNIGNIYWEQGNMKRAIRAFRNGIRLLEEVFEDITQEEIDYHDHDDKAIFYILEDYASIQYALGNKDEASKYFNILRTIDRHNHMRADIALDFLERNISWNEYVDFLDEAIDRYDADHGEEPSDGHN